MYIYVRILCEENELNIVKISFVTHSFKFGLPSFKTGQVSSLGPSYTGPELSFINTFIFCLTAQI